MRCHRKIGQIMNYHKLVLKISVGLLLILIVGCYPSLSELEEIYIDEEFPVGQIAKVELPQMLSLSQAQIAFCYYDQTKDPLYRNQEMKIISLDTMVIYDITQSFLTGPFGADLGCGEGIAWSPNGNFLLLGVGGLNGLVQAEIGAEGNQISEQAFLDLPRYTYYRGPYTLAWSPNGERLAFIGQSSRFPSVFLASKDGTQVKQLTDSFTLPGVVSEPVWSHNSDKIAYVLPIPANGIGIIDIDRGVVTEYNQDTVSQLSAGTDRPHGILPKQSIAWLPGDNLLLFLTNSESADKDILWIMEADGSNLEQLYEGPIQQVTLSPDGKMLTMIIADGKRSKIQILHLEQNLYIRTVLDSMDWELAKNGSVVFRDLNWSPDGSQLVFSANPNGNFDLFLWDYQSEIVTQLTNTPADETMPLWRPYMDTYK